VSPGFQHVRANRVTAAGRHNEIRCLAEKDREGEKTGSERVARCRQHVTVPSPPERPRGDVDGDGCRQQPRIRPQHFTDDAVKIDRPKRDQQAGDNEDGAGDCESTTGQQGSRAAVVAVVAVGHTRPFVARYLSPPKNLQRPRSVAHVIGISDK